MFEGDLSISDLETASGEPMSKKIKIEEMVDQRIIHSCLNYSTLKTPPLVEYKSIDGYCEKNIARSYDSPSTSNIKNLQNISSPIVFKSPKLIEKRTLPPNAPKPHLFFSIEELSLVTCLRNWTNTNVCPVGTVSLNQSTQECYLNSVMEKGNWRLLLDTSLLTVIPDFQKLLQAFGSLEVYDRIPRLKVKFCRNIESVDLPRFVESYKLMQKYIPIAEETQKQDTEEFDDTASILVEGELNDSDITRDCGQLNDTLDDYNFSTLV